MNAAKKKSHREQNIFFKDLFVFLMKVVVKFYLEFFISSQDVYF